MTDKQKRPRYHIRGIGQNARRASTRRQPLQTKSGGPLRRKSHMPNTNAAATVAATFGPAALCYPVPPPEFGTGATCGQRPHWILAPLSGAACTEAVRAHFSRCFALGEEMLDDVGKFVKVHNTLGCTLSECREINAQVDEGKVGGRRTLQNMCNLAEAAALSSSPRSPKAPAQVSRTRLKAVSKRR